MALHLPVDRGKDPPEDCFWHLTYLTHCNIGALFLLLTALFGQLFQNVHQTIATDRALLEIVGLFINTPAGQFHSQPIASDFVWHGAGDFDALVAQFLSKRPNIHWLPGSQMDRCPRVLQIWPGMNGSQARDLAE